MAEDKARGEARSSATRIIGSLRDALAAAGRDTGDKTITGLPADGARGPEKGPEAKGDPPMKQPQESKPFPPLPPREPQATQKVAATPAAQAAPAPQPQPQAPAADGVAPTRPAARAQARTALAASADGRTQLIRGRQKVTRTRFHQDPVVGWLVIVGGAGLGAFRPIYEGNNTVGRAPTQRVPIDFGDDTISGEEQAYIRYDSTDRKFLFVPNLAKTNVVQVNDQKPTGAVELSAMDVITMGRTQLVFVPFCGPEFDWGELTDIKE
jgi:hypothetical protein